MLHVFVKNSGLLYFITFTVSSAGIWCNLSDCSALWYVGRLQIS